MSSGLDVVVMALLQKKINTVLAGNISYEVNNYDLIIKQAGAVIGTITFPPPEDGNSIVGITVDINNHILATMEDGTVIDGGEIPHPNQGIFNSTNNHLYLQLNTGLIIDCGEIPIGDSQRIGDWTQLTMTGISTIVEALNELDARAITGVTFANKTFTVTYANGTTYDISVAQAFSDTNIEELNNVTVSNPQNGDVLRYDVATSTFINEQVSTTDQYVKMTPTDTTPAYLADLLDNDSVVNDAGKLSVPKIKGQLISVDELNTLLGMDLNVKDTLNSIATGGMRFVDVVPNYASLPTAGVNGDVYIVDQDETSASGTDRIAYIYADVHGGFVPVGKSGLTVRDFTTQPIDLTSEVTGKLPIDKIDTTDIVVKSTDLTGIYSTPIPEADLDKIPTLRFLKAVNTEVTTALGLKINIADIVDNLNSQAPDKPLSANQGYILGDKVSTNTNDIAQMKIDFQAGVDTLYDACVEVGATPVDKTPTAIADAIRSLQKALEEWQLWVQAGGLDHTTFSDINAVFADAITMDILMKKHASVDYLIDWLLSDTTILNGMANDEECMEYLGKYDYCADSMLKNPVLSSALLSSPHWRYLLKDHIPTMSSTIAPQGEAFSSGDNVSDGRYAWRAFDKVESTFWCSANQVENAYVGYRFTEPICVKKMFCKWAANGINAYVLQASNDRVNWVDLTAKTSVTTSYGVEYETLINNDDYYIYYRIYVYRNNWGGLEELDLFGRALNVSVPSMTSGTTPSGEVIYSSYYSSTAGSMYPYKIFDGIADDGSFTSAWATPENSSYLPAYIGYKFVNPVCIKQVHLTNRNYATRLSPKNFKVQASNDNITWDDLGSFTNNNNNLNARTTYDLLNEKSYTLYRIYIVDVNSNINSYNNVNIGTLQFYGVDYSE